MIETTLEHDGHTYSISIEGTEVSIFVDGAWATSGTWNGKQVDDAAAPLGDEAYEAIDEAVAAALDNAK